jgi:hypothetical protein
MELQRDVIMSRRSAPVQGVRRFPTTVRTAISDDSGISGEP